MSSKIFCITKQMTDWTTKSTKKSAAKCRHSSNVTMCSLWLSLLTCLHASVCWRREGQLCPLKALIKDVHGKVHWGCTTPSFTGRYLPLIWYFSCSYALNIFRASVAHLFSYSLLQKVIWALQMHLSTETFHLLTSMKVFWTFSW